MDKRVIANLMEERRWVEVTNNGRRTTENVFTGSIVRHYPRRLFFLLTLALPCVEEGRLRSLSAAPYNACLCSTRYRVASRLRRKTRSTDFHQREAAPRKTVRRHPSSTDHPMASSSVVATAAEPGPHAAGEKVAAAAVFWHEGMLAHDAGRGVFGRGLDPGFLDVLDHHPENADRVRNMELVQADSAGANNNKICECTFLNPGSWDAALLAAGTTLSAMKHILDGHAKIAYALVRPPGHHAQPDRADGYCFLNNAGLAVKLALDSGRRRVAVVDIDVHYGNGTAEGFYHTDSVLTISLHMKHGSWGPSHPQSGLVDETGEGRGLGYNLNIPLPNGSGDAGYEYAMNELVFDPNGRQCLTMDGYRKIGQIMRGMADQHSNGQILIVQEGGYHITYSAYCLHATLEGVLNLQAPLLDDPLGFYPDDEKYTMQAVDIIKKCWKESIPFLKDI
uniref:Histone deacetylase n=1 Tax=Oryza nivara TaxID=4536 RepID=A0A0E0HF46_ORYNI